VNKLLFRTLVVFCVGLVVANLALVIHTLYTLMMYTVAVQSFLLLAVFPVFVVLGVIWAFVFSGLLARLLEKVCSKS
jgi:hypothetical protein